MRKFMTGLLLLCAFVASSQNIAELDALVTAYAKLHKFNGTVLLARKGEIVLQKGYGWADVAAKRPNDAAGVYQIGSLTKQFTAAVILKLFEQHKLQLTDTIGKYFPAYPHGNEISIKHLLSHTSGIINFTSDREIMEKAMSGKLDKSQMLSALAERPLVFEPGSQWQYSNSNYILLGYIIEKLTGKTYQQAVRELLLNPLHMQETGFDYEHLRLPAKTQGYFGLNEVDTIPAPVGDSSLAYSAGSMYATAGDLYRWHRGLMEGKVLSLKYQELGYETVMNNYGYGWFADSIAGRRKIWHSGSIPGYTSYITRIPQDDICIILLSNASDPTLELINNALLAILYQLPYELPAARVVVQLPDELMEEYAGNYEMQPGMTIRVEWANGHLMAHPSGQPDVEWFAVGKDSLFMKSPDMDIHFRRDAGGKVEGFELIMGSQKMFCRKTGEASK